MRTKRRSTQVHLDPISRLYPEIQAGGFTRCSPRVTFYARVNALLDSEMTVLDFGAGRGKWQDSETGYVAELTTLRGKCERVIGADVDTVVTENPFVDEALILPEDGRIPLDTSSVDLIVSWAVFEHLQDPAFTAQELLRVLRPGGWLCAWTPNKWSYSAIGARLVPNGLHARMLRRVQPGSARGEQDVFPTVYRLNTRAALRRHFPPQVCEHFTYFFNGPPGYNFNKMVIARIWQMWARIMPEALAQSLHIFIRKI